MTGDRAAAMVSVGLLVAVAALTAGMTLGRASSDVLFYACAFAQSGVSVAAGRAAVANRSWTVLPILIAGAILTRFWLLVQVPTLSGDIYRYIWDGKVVNAGFNPYLHIPADTMLAGLRDPAQYGLIDKRDYAVTIYPPVAQALFALVTRLSTGVVAMKLAMVVCEGIAVLAVARLLIRLGRPVGGLATYLLHPAPLWEIAGNGHVDAAMMALLFGAFAWSGAPLRPYWAALGLTFGALVKPTAALALPAVWRPVQILLPLFVAGLVLACYLPFLGAGPGVVGFLPSYAHEQGLDTGHGFYWIALLQHLGLDQPSIVTGYSICAATALMGLALLTRRGGAADLRARLRGTALLIVAALLLLTPLFPWYALAALPMTPLLGMWSPFALSTGGFLLYGFHDAAPALFVRWSLAIGLVVAAAAYDCIRMRTP